MNLKGYLKQTFGKDIFSHLKSNEILEERIRCEKKVEHISDDISNIQEKIQRLMIDAKGKPRAYKLLNIQKIKALKLESNTKAVEAGNYLKQLQILLLLDAMREHQKTKETSQFIDKVLNSDVEHLTDVLFSKDVQKAIEEGKMDDVKERLRRVFAKEELPVDNESQDLLKTINDLESVDDETALKMAESRARSMAEAPLKKKEEEEEE